MVATDAKDLTGEMISSPLNQVYYTGEVGFIYGRWNGKGNGDYWQNYVSGQVGNDHFQINAGASFENWSGNSSKIRGLSIFEISAAGAVRSKKCRIRRAARFVRRVDRIFAFINTGL